MTNEEKIKKWLAGELSDAERKKFESTREFAEISKLMKVVRNFKAPEYDVDSEYVKLTKISHDTSRTVPPYGRISPLLKIAAILILALTIGYVSWMQFSPASENQEWITEQSEVYLPDSSFISLNAGSSISYKGKTWKKERRIELKGEAFFRVRKGSKFDVNTEHGRVTVLGTEFTVKDRDNFYQVNCYSGSVRVITKEKSVVLQPNSAFRIINGKAESLTLSGNPGPDWLNGESSFKSVPLKFVIRELERQYKVSVDSRNVDVNQLFTGSFSNGDLEIALKSITFPLNLNYEISDKKIVITLEGK